MTTTSIASRNAELCSLIQSFTHAPDRPGANPSIRPGLVVSASTNEVSHGSLAVPACLGQDPTAQTSLGLIDPEHLGGLGFPQPPCGGGDQCSVRRRPRHPMSTGDLLDRPVPGGDLGRQRGPQPAGQPRPRGIASDCCVNERVAQRSSGQVRRRLRHHSSTTCPRVKVAGPPADAP